MGSHGTRPRVFGIGLSRTGTTSLDMPIPDIPFPFKNDRESRLQWFDALAAATADIEALIPKDAAFVLIDHNAFSDTALMQYNAVTLMDWGLPADDSEAISAVEAKRAQGTQYLALAWPAFWWLDHYRGFAGYLRDRFDCVLDNERFIVFALDRRQGQAGGRSTTGGVG